MILAGITLNAVIGEDGIIFQAKDTKNMITNETTYDNEQLAALQNELRDNQLYTGIGIIPGTDTGGSSEGGESGSGGSGNQGGGGNQGGSNTGGTNTNTGGSEGELVGEDAVPPTITVLEGEEIAASFFRSDVTIQISTYDKTQKIKYILTTTVDEINNELYPSGLIKEIDIENGGTLTFTKDGEYTITAYSYDVRGNKSNSSVMWLKRETGTTTGSGVTVSVASGNMGQNEWYTSNITLRVLGTDTGSSRVTYRVRGTAYGNGTIGNTEYQAGEVDTGEVEIANGTTFRIAIDGEFAVVAYTYDSGGMRLSTAPTVNLKRDATRPVVTAFTGEQVVGSGFQLSITASDAASDLASNERYTYRHKLAPEMTYTDQTSQETTKLYAGLQQNKTYDMYVIVKDEAGNMTASDVISKPALWISNTPTVGEVECEEGGRKYIRTDIELSMTGQDENNVDISRVTYQILGTTTGAGIIDGVDYDRGVALSTNEIEIGNKKILQIQADGNWTIKVHTYNKENVRVTTNTIEVTRDTVGPTISNFTKTGMTTTTVSVNVSAIDATSGLSTKNDTYAYYLNSENRNTSGTNSYTYAYTDTASPTLKVIVKDKAGNTSESSITPDIIFLVDKASIGDVINNYSAGGITSWRVLSKSGSGATGTVTLVAMTTNKTTTPTYNNIVNSLNSTASGYVNSTYASSSRSITNTEFSNIVASNSLLNTVTTNYWLAVNETARCSICKSTSCTGASNQLQGYFGTYANGGTISNQGVQIAGYGYQSLGYFNSRVNKVYSLITTGSSYSNGRCSQNDKIAGCFGTDYNSSYMPGYNGGSDSTQPTEYYGYSYGAWTYYGSSTSNDRYTVSGNNQFFSKTINYAVRPVVVLKAGVKTEDEKIGDGWQI